MRKRSSYKPKGIRLDAHLYALTSVRPLTKVSEATVLKIKNHDALDAIVKGIATRDHVDALIAAMNIAEAYALHGKGQDWIPEIRAAQDAVLSMARRGLDKGRFVFSGPELMAVNEAMAVHDQQLDESFVKEIEKMANYVATCIKNGKARLIDQNIKEVQGQSS